MADDYSGFQSLGALIGGGGEPAPGSKAYIEGLRGGYDAQRAGYERDQSREEARRARAMAIAREAIPDALNTAGYREELQPLLAAILQGNSTMDLGQIEDYGTAEAGNALAAAAAAAAEGDTMGQNRNTALAQGKPFEPFGIEAGGDVLLNAGTGDYELTDLGVAGVDATQALALSREASAAASAGRQRVADATVRKIDRTDPNAPRTRAAAEPTAGKYTVGQVIEHNGKRYRVTSIADPSDPDVEEIP